MSLRMTSPKLSVGQKAAKSVVIIERKLKTGPVYAGLIIATFILYLALLVFNFLAIVPSASGGLFSYGVLNIPRDFSINFTPAGWAYYIWGLIYLLQLVWLIYSIGLIWQRNNEEPGYHDPLVLSPAFFIFFNISSAFNIGWLFLWDRLLFLASFVFLACIALSLLLTAAILASRLVAFRSTLIDQGRNNEVIFLKIVATNSIAMFTTWTVVSAVLNLGIILVYKRHTAISEEIASIVCLSILAFLSLIYIGLDLTLIEPFTRYSLSPYAVVIWTVAASLAQNYDPENLSSIMSLFFVGAVGLVFFMRLGLTFYRSSGVKGQYRLMKMGRSSDDLSD